MANSNFTPEIRTYALEPISVQMKLCHFFTAKDVSQNRFSASDTSRSFRALVSASRANTHRQDIDKWILRDFLLPF